MTPVARVKNSNLPTLHKRERNKNKTQTAGVHRGGLSGRAIERGPRAEILWGPQKYPDGKKIDIIFSKESLEW